MTKYIDVKQADELINVIHNQTRCFLRDVLSVEEYDEYKKDALLCDIITYKLAFETLAKNVRGWAEHHDNGSLIVSLIRESNEQLEKSSSEEYHGAFTLIEKSLAKLL